jgi:hypothetical protein
VLASLPYPEWRARWEPAHNGDLNDLPADAMDDWAGEVHDEELRLLMRGWADHTDDGQEQSPVCTVLRFDWDDGATACTDYQTRHHPLGALHSATGFVLYREPEPDPLHPFKYACGADCDELDVSFLRRGMLAQDPASPRSPRPAPGASMAPRPPRRPRRRGARAQRSRPLRPSPDARARRVVSCFMFHMQR